MSLAAFIARRYLFSPKSHAVINRIALLSVAAVAMPVAAMIVLLSVFNGFEGLIRSMTTAFDPDLTVSARQGTTFPVAEIDTVALKRIEGVEALSFLLEQSALVEHGGRQATVTIRGVDDAYEGVLPVDETITAGRYRVRLGDLEQLVAGQAMAYLLGIRSLADADVTIYALRRRSFSPLLPLENFSRRTVPVGGIYTLDMDTERQYALVSLRLAQEVFDYPGRASALAIRLAPGADAAAVKRAVAETTGGAFRVQTRYELKASFYDIMTYEKWGIFFISLLVLAVSSFSVVGALTMLVLDKRRDTAALRALGADRAFVRAVFRGEGWLICGLGAAIGVGIGVGASLVQQHFGLIEIPAETFLMKSYPVEFRFADLLAVLAAFGAVAALVTELTVRSMIRKTNTI